MSLLKKLKKAVSTVGKVTGTTSLNKALFAPTKKNVKGAINDPVLQAGALVSAAIVAAPALGASSGVSSESVATLGSLVAPSGGGGGSSAPASMAGNSATGGSGLVLGTGSIVALIVSVVALIALFFMVRKK